MKCTGHSSLCFLCRVALWKVLICSVEVLGGPSLRRLLCRATAFHHNTLCLITSEVVRQLVIASHQVGIPSVGLYALLLILLNCTEMYCLHCLKSWHPKYQLPDLLHHHR